MSFPGTAIPALACSCDRNTGIPACSLYRGTAIIFRGHVVEKIKSKSHDPIYRMQVEESFKGLRSDAAEVMLDTGSGCGMGFQPGKDYLIYIAARHEDTNQAMPVLYVDACSPSREIQKNDPDLVYLRHAVRSQVPSNGWMEGVVVQNGGWPSPYDYFVAAPNTTVTAKNGDWVRSTVAKPDGTFRLDDLKPGTQAVSFTSPGLPTGRMLTDREQSTEVPAGGCAYVHAGFDINSTMAGRVLTASGKPAAGVRVELGEIQPDERVRTIGNAWADTAKDGTFLIKNVPVGKIVLTARLNQAPNKNSPHLTVYAPGVQSLSGARIFSVKPDEKVTGVMLRLGGMPWKGNGARP